MSTCPPALPSGCEEALAFVDEPAPCLSDARCDEVRARPDREARWTLIALEYLQDEDGNDVFLSPAEIEHEADCLTRYLVSLDVVPRLSADRDTLTFESSFGRIGSVLHFAALSRYELACSEPECARCQTLAEEDCRADPFCWARDGTRVDPERNCSETRFGGCLRGDLGCGDALTTATDPGGACWQFSSGCVPSAFEPATAGCDYEFVATAPACPMP
jgi:hypothetical protein